MDNDATPSSRKSGDRPERFVELTNDLLFHMVFSMSEKARKDLVSSLLNIPLEEIESVELLNPIQYNGSIDTKETILDLRIKLNNKSIVIVELQVKNFKYWTNRILIYGCRNINDQTDGKEAYIHLEPVIQVSIMDYTLFPKHKVFYDEYKIQDDDHQVLTDKLRFFVMDLTATDEATEDDKKRGLVQWAKAFNAGDWDALEKIDRPGIKEAVKTMETIMSDPVQRQIVWDRHLALMDYNSGLIGAKEEGFDEGRREGRKEGILETTKENARRMKAKGYPSEDIAEITGLSVAEIEALV